MYINYTVGADSVRKKLGSGVTILYSYGTYDKISGFVLQNAKIRSQDDTGIKFASTNGLGYIYTNEYIAFAKDTVVYINANITSPRGSAADFTSMGYLSEGQTTPTNLKIIGTKVGGGVSLDGYFGCLIPSGTHKIVFHINDNADYLTFHMRELYYYDE